MPRVLAPRGQWSYTKPVYLLVGRGCFSSNETFVAAMSALPQVTVAGDTTGGGSGNPIEREIRVDGRNTGWRYSVPRWIERTADGKVIEWNGIAPDVHVSFAAAAVAGGVDPVLEWALARARQ
jgi:C-terminal processing protease CtpA/Prc